MEFGPTEINTTLNSDSILLGVVLAGNDQEFAELI